MISRKTCKRMRDMLTHPTTRVRSCNGCNSNRGGSEKGHYIGSEAADLVPAWKHFYGHLQSHIPLWLHIPVHMERRPERHHNGCPQTHIPHAWALQSRPRHVSQCQSSQIPGLPSAPPRTSQHRQLCIYLLCPHSNVEANFMLQATSARKRACTVQDYLWCQYCALTCSQAPVYSAQGSPRRIPCEPPSTCAWKLGWCPYGLVLAPVAAGFGHSQCSRMDQ